MSTPTQPTESLPLGDAPELLPVKNIDGMEPYDTFFKRISRAIFHRWEDPTSLVTLDDRNTPLTSWQMAQIVVSVLHNLPTTLDSKEERNWVVKHFQLREESTQDPDHIFLPTNGVTPCSAIATNQATNSCPSSVSMQLGKQATSLTMRLVTTI
ncbi:hypothetical protein ARMGADRAFT_159427 [Armillaria gallica]|uniref:Uncharacterized protein n=1 Tax=Armillaria gallica TaxID=47427 RepID=A0A2H3DE38_ARMGA|nr:hypothetical protein ARMGADRAFT_159427 [Armillaria gallica]